MTTLRPLGDRIVVRPIDPEKFTKTGILLPTASLKTPTEGIVVSTSDSDFVDVGDRVVFSAYGGTSVEIDGEELIILSFEETIAVLGGVE